MRLLNLLPLPVVLATTAVAATEPSDYREHLHLKPLPGAALYAGFQFNASTSLSAYESQHFRFFPRSLAQILQFTHTVELHLRFSLGRWDEESWGSRPRSGSREGGNGVELWAWLEDDGEGTAERRWSDLVNSLSGLFCASLNFINSGKTTRPVLSFDPEGTLEQWQSIRRNSPGAQGSKLTLLHGMLPHEVVCTENLTPFLKLLPCKGQAGIGSLLDGHKLFDSSWQAMSIDVKPDCTTAACNLNIQQTVDMVLDIPRSMRPRSDPIPRPIPIEQLVCDDAKYYHADDVCFPKARNSEMEWSLQQVFGRPISGRCPLSPQEWYDVTLEVPTEQPVTTSPDRTPCSVSTSPNSTDVHSCHLVENQDFDLKLPPHATDFVEMALNKPPLFATRQITGYGAQRGGMHTILTNPHPYPQNVVYLESLPWFLRPYIHTLKVAGGKIVKMYYTPLLDRERGTHLELLIEIPAQSTVTLTYDFEKATLRYTEYPPDANRGFDVPPAIIRVLPRSNATTVEGKSNLDYYLRTTSLLLPLPTPDFSMPYNVIILTSTVIALGFGSIFNLIVRRFVLLEEVPPSKLAISVKRILAKFKALLNKPNATKSIIEPRKELLPPNVGTDPTVKPKRSNGNLRKKGQKAG